jgi:lipopolysaccharide export system protein LptA
VITRNTLVLLAAVALPVASGDALSQTKGLLEKHDSSQPITVDADRMAADLNGKSVLYTGNVIVTQGDITLHADSVRLTTVEGKATQNIQATGHVRMDSPASGTVTGDSGLYDANAHAVVVTGNVVLKHGTDVMRGTRLSVNLVTGQAVLGAPGATPASNGRVKGVFTPTAGK